MQYLSDTHLRLAILAGISLAIVTLPLPILLFFYQFKFFQAILSSCCSTRIREGLRTFVEAFQGYYRDGSDGERDYRFFASIYILLRIIAFSIRNLPFLVTNVTNLISCILVGVIYAMVRPYKQNIFNIVDGLILVNTGFLYLFIILADLLNQVRNGIPFIIILILVSLVLPLVYITILGMYWVLYSTCLKKTCQRLKTTSKLGTLTQVETLPSGREQEGHALNTTCSLPDRIINPNNYQEI